MQKRTERNAFVHFTYDEAAVLLAMEHDEERNTVVIRGGSHGLAALAQLFQIYGQSRAKHDDDHWSDLTVPDPAFTIILDAGLAKEER